MNKQKEKINKKKTRQLIRFKPTMAPLVAKIDYSIKPSISEQLRMLDR
jgi:hypothetical protein